VAKLIINPTAANRRELSLSRDQILTIGRDPSNDLVLPDAMVSRRHAVIEHRGSQFFLRDCSSANGSVVNGDRVSERGLRDGDLVAIGSMRLLFREEPAEPGAKVVPHPSSAPFHCPSCGADYRRGDVFCKECGTRVAQPSGPPKAVCASCGTAVPLPARFCNACGSTLATDGQEPAAPARADVSLSGETPIGPLVPPDKLGRRDAPRVPRRSDREDAAGTGGQQAPAAALEPEPLRPPRVDPSPNRRTAPQRRPAAPRPSPGRPAPAIAARPAARLVAALVDGAIVAVGLTVVLAPVALYWWSRELPASPVEVSFLGIVATVALVVLAALAGVLYFLYGWGVRGATPGKQMMGLRVETDDGAYPIGPGRAGIRVLGYLLSAASLGIGFLMIAIGGSGLHDRVAGTRVVEGPRT